MTDRLRVAAQALVDRWDTPLWKDTPHTGKYINELRAALAEKTEDWDRVAALEESLREHMDEIHRLRADIKDMIERPVVEVSMDRKCIENAEPYLWYADDTGDTWTPEAVADGYAPTDLKPLYTAPPRREWVSLTDEEVVDLWAGVSPINDDDVNIVELGRAIEAALREKNGGNE